MNSASPAPDESRLAALALNDQAVPAQPAIDVDDNANATTDTGTAIAVAEKKRLAYAFPPPPDYPPLTPLAARAPIAILSTPSKGRGVFATESIAAGTVVEISPILLLSKEEYYGGGKEGDLLGVEGSMLRGYVFSWRGGGMALALGLGSLFNHSSQPNLSFELQPQTHTIQFKAFRTIAAGEELSIFYGHRASFDDATASNKAGQLSDSEDEGEWGGLAKIPEPAKQLKWDEEIIEFEYLNWIKVTNEIDPEKQPLEVFDAYVLDIPAALVQHIFSITRSIYKGQNDPLHHLKRVRPLPSLTKPHSDPTQPPVEVKMISVLLFPVHAAPENFMDLLTSSKLASEHPEVDLTPYVLPVPKHIARTETQGEEWGKIWPVLLVHIREGPKATKRSKGWERIKAEWVGREAGKCWAAAKEAGRRGENPIASHATETFDPAVHSPTKLPSTIAKSHDTRHSTRNVLSHSCSNLIDAIALLDIHGLRDSSAYLLTGLTIFTSHEPCLLCSMSLLHSRIKELYFIKSAPGSGGCGSVYAVHEDKGLNHGFEVWKFQRTSLGFRRSLAITHLNQVSSSMSLDVDPELLPLIGYFALIAFLLVLVSPALLRKPTAKSLVYGALAIASLGVTWTYMFLYFERSYIEAALRANVRPQKFTAKEWLADVSLFNEAWSYVVATPERWWWSQQLCLFTAGPFTAMLLHEGRRKDIKFVWAYMVLGQIVAISFAQALFFAALELATTNSIPATKQGQSRDAVRAGPLITSCTLLSLATVGISPYTINTPYFLPNLLVMHALLILPLLPFPSAKSPRASIPYSTLYALLGGISLALRLPAFYDLHAISSSPTQVLKTLFLHPAQSSISFDVVFATLGMAIFAIAQSGKRSTKGTLTAFVSLPVLLPLGVGVWAGMYLGLREKPQFDAAQKGKAQGGSLTEGKEE
ncbi:Set and Cytidine deaminase-like domain containing protein [Pseudohyphozyma bogoriensis]|nr:Set and Cytidine deaminase-like domain containing protein [Pseudohyphozyma bogoriensis]